MLSPSKAAHPGGFFRFSSRRSGLCRSNRYPVRFNYQPVSSLDPAARSLHASFKGKDSWTSHSDRADVSRSALACVAVQLFQTMRRLHPIERSGCSSSDRLPMRERGATLDFTREGCSPRHRLQHESAASFFTAPRCCQRGATHRAASAPALASASSSLSLARPIEKTLHANHLVRILVTPPRSRVAAQTARATITGSSPGGRFSLHGNILVVFTLGRAGKNF